MVAHLTFVSSGANATGISMIFGVDNDKYSVEAADLRESCLINAGDSCQLLASTMKFKLKTIRYIFLTSLAPHCCSGLAGVLLSLSDSGCDQVNIFGPPGLEGLIASMRTFVNRQYPVIVAREIGFHCIHDGIMDISTKFFTVKLLPIFSVPINEKLDTPRNAIGISYLVTPLNQAAPSSTSSDNSVAKLEAASIAVLALERSYKCYPSVVEQFKYILKIPNCLLSSCISVSCGVSSFGLIHRRNSDSNKVQLMCRSSNVVYVTAHGDEDDNVVEFPTSQQQILLLGSLFGSFFPKSIVKDEKLATEAAAVDTDRLSGSKRQRQDPDNNCHQHGHRCGGYSCLQLRFAKVIGEEHYHRNSTDSDTETASDSDNEGDRDSDSNVDSGNLGYSASVSHRYYYRLNEACSNSNSYFDKDSITAEVGKDMVHRAILQRHQQYQSILQNSIGADVRVAPQSNVLEDRAGFRLMMLGTGCATPSKYRHSSAIMISFDKLPPVPILVVPMQPAPPLSQPPPPPMPRPPPPQMPPPSAPPKPPTTITESKLLPPLVSILLDCGEGCAGQLFQQVDCNRDRFDGSLLSIRVIWISHHHADHICGLPMLIQHIHKANLRQFQKNNFASSRKMRYEPTKVLIIAPSNVANYYTFCLTVAGLEDYVTIMPIEHTMFAGMNIQAIASTTSGFVTRLISVPVQHCKDSYACVLEFPNNSCVGKRCYKLVYSGDCRPSMSLLSAGKYCDVLIHEATFADDMLNDAVLKRHSTQSEALEMARQLCVGRSPHLHARMESAVVEEALVVLTHFSQRYPKSCGNSSSSGGGGAGSLSSDAKSAALSDSNEINIDIMDHDDLASASSKGKGYPLHAVDSRTDPITMTAALKTSKETLPVLFAVDNIQVQFPSQARMSVGVSQSINIIHQCIYGNQ